MSPASLEPEPSSLAARTARRGDEGDPAPDLAQGRRAALKAGALAIAGLLAPAAAEAQVRRKGPAPAGPRTPNPTTTVDLQLIDPTAAWLSPNLRLARRITMGLTEAEAALARSMTYDAYLEYHLAADVIDDSAVDAFVAANYPDLALGPAALINLDAGSVQSQLTNATIYRAAFSARQLKERLVEFWSDHFNIDITKVGYLKVIDDRDVIRQYAMTSFPQLLRASAHSPAMLVYLDQTLSTKGAPNQNYAREIMELHTLGVNGGYTQTDVAELSRVLTGWTISGQGVFAFDPNRHDYTTKTVLGITFPTSTQAVLGAAAQSEGEAVLTALVGSPATATFVSTKMLRYFLRYDPTDAQVAAVASVYLTSGGDIKSMLRTVLSQQNLVAAPAKFKRPFHLVTSGVRVLKAAVANSATLSSQITTAGQPIFTFATPDGFPDRAEYWAGNIMPRWNYASFIANANTATSVRVDVAPFMTTPTAAAIVSAIDRACFGGEMTQRLRDELTAYVAVSPTSTTRVREAISLALSSSTFQYF
ncbi:MAG: DUF1800 domain-containing protein [Gemmatimonadales bacterium]